MFWDIISQHFIKYWDTKGKLRIFEILKFFEVFSKNIYIFFEYPLKTLDSLGISQNIKCRDIKRKLRCFLLRYSFKIYLSWGILCKYTFLDIPSKYTFFYIFPQTIRFLRYKLYKISSYKEKITFLFTYI